ncbi:FAD:protein FMN transferase [Aliiglaciecola litoralis]|uniref:FAD:protein FMN transferase n=1 Tax=Aliiglaciecola litoralis TaxID=582857 RepID=A0ABP3WRK4_9ALTE
MIKVKVISLLGSVIVILLLLLNATQEVTDVHLTGPTMGTSYNVKIRKDEGLVVSADELKDKIDQRLAKINKLMSTYDPHSELSRFNQHHSTLPFTLSAETMLVLREAKRLGELSDGVLDVTVGPLVNLWGFGPDAKPEVIPSKATIEALKQKIGLDKLYLGSNTASKLTPDLYVDLSTIAKGYGVDEIANLLESLGHTNYLVEIGGEMRVAGLKGNGIAWRIAVEQPVIDKRDVQTVLSIGNNAIATSGDYRNYFEENGVRYSHLIDPRTGYPIQHNLVSVTVVHPSSMTADGLATALGVMGKDAALRLAQEQQLDVMLITREKDGFKTYTSGRFDEYIQAAKQQN